MVDMPHKKAIRHHQEADLAPRNRWEVVMVHTRIHRSLLPEPMED
jgi:hypothetical protein